MNIIEELSLKLKFKQLTQVNKQNIDKLNSLTSHHLILHLCVLLMKLFILFSVRILLISYTLKQTKTTYPSTDAESDPHMSQSYSL